MNVFPSPDVSRALDNVCNSEAKSIAYVALDAQNESVTCNELQEKITEQTGLAKSTLRGVAVYPLTFEKENFATSFDGTGRSGRPAKFYSTKNAKFPLAVAGALNEWSLGCEHLALIKVLSYSASKGSKAPSNSVQILRELLKGKNIGEADLPGYKPEPDTGWQTSHNTRLYKMVEDGLLIAEDDPNAFKILEPKYKGTKPLEQLSPAVRAAYTVLKFAKILDPDKKWTTQELVALALENQLIETKTTTKLSRFIYQAASQATPAYAPGAIDKIKFKPRKYSIAPAFVEDARSLVAKLELLSKEDPKVLSKMSALAHEHFRNGAIAKRLLLKGINNSSFTAKARQKKALSQ